MTDGGRQSAKDSLADGNQQEAIREGQYTESTDLDTTVYARTVYVRLWKTPTPARMEMPERHLD